VLKVDVWTDTSIDVDAHGNWTPWSTSNRNDMAALSMNYNGKLGLWPSLFVWRSDLMEIAFHTGYE